MSLKCGYEKIKGFSNPVKKAEWNNDIKNSGEDLKLKIGLFGIDPKYHNLALMKLST